MTATAKSLRLSIHEIAHWPLGKAGSASTDATRLAREFAERLDATVRAVAADQSITETAAYVALLAAGQNSDLADDVLDGLFNVEGLHRLPRREAAILALSAFLLWDQDPALARTVNPFEPYAELLRRGYACDVLESEETDEQDVGRPVAVHVQWCEGGAWVGQQIQLPSVGDQASSRNPWKEP